MNQPADRQSTGRPGTGRQTLLLRVTTRMVAPRTGHRHPATRWLLTWLGRAPERSGLATECRQCGQWDRVTVFRLNRRRARYWCRRCGAVVAVPDRATLRTIEVLGNSPAPARQLPAVEPVMREVMPGAMLAWLSAGNNLPASLDQLDKPTIYQLYRRWDGLLRRLPADRLAALAVGAPPPQPGLPAFSAAVGAVENRCYHTELAVGVLAGQLPESGAAVHAALWERAEHARRWLALRGREWSWIHSRLPGGRLAEPDRAEVEAALAALRSGVEPPPEQGRAARAALLGTKGGPRLPTLAQIYSPERLQAALEAYLDSRARPLRDDVLTRLAAPLKPPPTAHR